MCEDVKMLVIQLVMFFIVEAKKFIFEYPQDWVKKADHHNMIFLNNITTSLIELNLVVSLLPVSYPTYGIPRNNTSNPYLSFHSYENPSNIWSYKEAPIKGLYSIDPKGYGGWADIAQNLDKYKSEIEKIQKPDDILEPYIQQLKKGLSKYKQSKAKVTLDDGFILFALQVRTDSVADHAYLDVVDVLNEVSLFAKKFQQKVVIKLHPKCDSELLKAQVFKLCQENKWLEVSNSDITQLIQLSKSILACNSGVSLEALILNKKVYCFGQSEWSVITHCITQIDQIKQVFTNDEQNYSLNLFQKKYLAYLLLCYWVRFDDQQAIKNKLQRIVAENESLNHLNVEEVASLNLLEAQKQYTKKMKRINLIERDFEYQNKLLKDIRTNPFFMIVYFLKFNFIKLKNKIGL
ncbi:hypothetical protein EXE09_03300 [Acinetobacter sp. WCHAc060025]|nr:hypothetical protein EXE09_03300 [Acinetobacter sp. WCHAc060025]